MELGFCAEVEGFCAEWEWFCAEWEWDNAEVENSHAGGRLKLPSRYPPGVPCSHLTFSLNYCFQFDIETYLLASSNGTFGFVKLRLILESRLTAQVRVD